MTFLLYYLKWHMTSLRRPVPAGINVSLAVLNNVYYPRHLLFFKGISYLCHIHLSAKCKHGWWLMQRKRVVMGLEFWCLYFFVSYFTTDKTKCINSQKEKPQQVWSGVGGTSKRFFLQIFCTHQHMSCLFTQLKLFKNVPEYIVMQGHNT